VNAVHPNWDSLGTSCGSGLGSRRECQVDRAARVEPSKSRIAGSLCRCQATTVSGFTMTNVEGQSRQRRERETPKRRSPELNFGRFLRERRRTLIC